MAKKAKDDVVKVFSKYITLKNGKRIYASQYGLEAFCFEVKKKRK